MNWQDHEWENGDEGPSFPFIQIAHDPGMVEPRPEIGGMFQPQAQAEAAGAAIPGTPATFHCDGGAIPGVFTPQLTIAVLKARRMFVTGRKENKRRVEEFGPGVRSHVQAACLVRGADGAVMGPMTLSVMSTVAGAFWQALRAHREDVQEATKNKGKPYGFWMTFRAESTERTSEGGMVTRFGRANGAFDPEEAFVGDDALKAVNWDELQEWAEAWESSNGNNSHKYDAGAPASDGRWRVIRTLLADLGIEGQEAQDAKILKQTGYDPAGLTNGQANELIDRLREAKAKKIDRAPQPVAQ